MIIAQVVLEELIHRNLVAAGKAKLAFHVTDLGSKESVDCPRNRRAPVVPPPPDGTELHKRENSELFECFRVL